MALGCLPETPRLNPDPRRAGLAPAASQHLARLRARTVTSATPCCSALRHSGVGRGSMASWLRSRRFGEARSSNRESDGQMTSAPIRDPLAGSSQKAIDRTTVNSWEDTEFPGHEV